jgi:hypothetical protein
VLNGRCACNAVAYEVSDEFVAAYNCHCSNCRALTGSAFLPWGDIEREKLTVTKGAESLLVEGDPDAAYAVRCGQCFSLLYWTPRDGYVRVPYGTLVDEPTLKPMAHMFVGSKAPWHEILDDLPQHDEYPWSWSADTGNATASWVAVHYLVGINGAGGGCFAPRDAFDGNPFTVDISVENGGDQYALVDGLRRSVELEAV